MNLKKKRKNENKITVIIMVCLTSEIFAIKKVISNIF